MSETGSEIHFREDGPVGRITLDRPKALNALSHAMCADMLAQLGRWRDAPHITYVIIEAVPGRAFCAGGDIRAVCELGERGDPRALEFFATEYRLNAAIKHFPKPIVALIDGIVMGGGAGISVHGKYRVVTEKALFAMPETAIGFFPDVGGSYFLSRCPGSIGMYLGLTGARLHAADMVYAGLATHFVPAVHLGEVAACLAAGGDADSLLAKLKDDPGPPPLAQHRAAIDRAFCAPCVEAILEALSREGGWGARQAEQLGQRSPTSLKIVHRQINQAMRLDFDACLRMEFRIAAEVLKGHDFYEGVRAVLIEKGRPPKWRPGELDKVSETQIARHFAPHGPDLAL